MQITDRLIHNLFKKTVSKMAPLPALEQLFLKEISPMPTPCPLVPRTARP